MTGSPNGSPSDGPSSSGEPDPSGQPPRLATLVLRLLVSGSDREHLLGDLEEEFRRRVAGSGERTRHLAWYWGQVLRSLPPLVVGALASAARGLLRPGPFLEDLRFYVRGLARRPGFTAIALLTLVVGIGVNTAVFSVVRAVVLRPLPFDEPERLVRLQGLEVASAEPNNLSPADFMDLESAAATVSRMGAHGWIGPATVSDGLGQAERLGRVEVTDGYFPTLGVEPALGGLFTAEHDRPGAEPVVILTDGLWRRMFGADPAIVGRTILVNAEPATVVGVLPPSYRHIETRPDRTADFFMPYGFETADPNRGGHFIRAVARAAPERTITEVRAELETIAARLEQQYPQDNTGRSVHVELLHDSVVGDARGTLFILLGASGLVLLIACANIGNLLLADGARRERELSVRAALGASRRRLVRQLFTECLVLGVLGALGGLLAATLATGPLSRLADAGIPRATEIGIDLSVLAFAALVALVAVAAFGILPALALPSTRLSGGLTSGGRQAGETVGRRPREALIAAEVALSVVLLVGAGLLVATLVELRGVPTGFQSTRVIGMEVAPPLARYPEGTQIPFHREFEDAVRGLPGIEAVGAVNILPLSNNYDGRSFFIDDRPMPEPGQLPSAQARSVTTGYFEAMEIPLLRGRLFEPTDDLDSPLVTVISEAMADTYWPGENPIGRRITWNNGVPDEALRAACPELEDLFFCVGGPGSREVIGVVGDVKHLDLREEDPVPMFYTPNTQNPSYHTMTWVVRSPLEPGAAASAIRSSLAEIDVEVPLSNVRTLDEVLSRAVAQPRVRAGLIGLFALLAVILACVGVYGVVSFLVARRVQEIGIRLALGASDAQVVRMLTFEGLRPVLIGLAIGLPAALAFSRVLEGLLFGITPLHPAVYVLACVALSVAGFAATLVPARRALGVQPSVAFREG